MRVQRRQAANEQRRCGVGGKGNAARQAGVGVVGAGHPVDERAHHRHAAEHGQVGHDGHPQCAFLGQHDRGAIANDPADLGGTDKRRDRRDRGEDQRVGQVHVADAFFFTAYFFPFLIGMGK
ncbi:hypothetical protein D3C78_1313670 [compost metagenome]